MNVEPEYIVLYFSHYNKEGKRVTRTAKIPYSSKAYWFIINFDISTAGNKPAMQRLLNKGEVLLPDDYLPDKNEVKITVHLSGEWYE